ncbi:bstEII [Chloroflexus sp.]|uniref:bstEII n=1 Tax=Chloroflexus sp. TaxID=1904827 RepID=UPI002ADD69BB|nr:bstEII [Chloroflexus sp.]
MSNSSNRRKRFADYKTDAHNWITLSTNEYYPDILPYACELYKPVLVLFGQLIKSSESSERLLQQISEIRQTWMRVQLLRVFRRYVSPSTPVEMTKRKTSIPEIIKTFGGQFRPIQEVQEAYNSRPLPDEALCAILWEYRDRGRKGYDLTERFFEMVRTRLPNLTIQGPERAGKDILMGSIFFDYPNPNRPVDFAIYGNTNDVLAIGLARYDSDRGGAQEDDRPGQYQSVIAEILGYTQAHNLGTKIILLNDGPGLLLGSMWDDYVRLEERYPDKVMVLTLRMVPERLTLEWLRSE